MSLADQAAQQLDRLSAVILDDVGDGPRPTDLQAAAKSVRDAVGQLSVPALTQLAGLVSGVADSIVAGATEWNPSLGGTLIAAVDDLRHLTSRPFNDEDAEHLAHRASELRPYARPVPAGEPQEETPVSPPVANAAPAEPRPGDKGIIPISDLFYADAGPHIVSGGTPHEAAGKSDLLARGIDALDDLTMKPIARQVVFGAIEVVPVETLLYRGRAALERAAAIREQIKAAGGTASPAALDEMYDLIGLALKD